jgi:hypothetical protein
MSFKVSLKACYELEIFVDRLERANGTPEPKSIVYINAVWLGVRECIILSGKVFYTVSMAISGLQKAYELYGFIEAMQKAYELGIIIRHLVTYPSC